jgi:hypothetical protein
MLLRKRLRDLTVLSTGGGAAGQPVVGRKRANKIRNNKNGNGRTSQQEEQMRYQWEPDLT